ncbi:MAG: hypothetical protein L0Y57_10065 [Beijerinckiaceae bacterium]|nr:hypothetical protein [Beijerinckiaceae bacterium]
MTGTEEELPKPAAESGSGPGALQSDLSPVQTPVESPEPQLLAATEGTGMQLEAEEQAPAAAPEEPQEGNQMAGDAPAQTNGPEATVAEIEEPAGGMAAAQPVPAAAKPRSLFPALTATALAGAVLGLGGSYALRQFEDSQPYGIITDERVTALSARLDDLESKQKAADSAARSALSAVESRAAAAETAANKAAELAAAAGAGAEAQKAETSQPNLQASSNGSSPAAASDLAPLEARIASLEQKLVPLETAPASAKTQVRAEAERENPADGQASRAAAVAIVAENLLRKLDHGEEFSAELAALENLGAPEAALAPLRATPASAVSTQRQLTARFESLAPKIIESESAAAAAGDENFLDRLTRHAKGLVHYRRTGDTEAADVYAIVSRIESALADRDIESAYKGWSQLPGPAKIVSQGWGEAAKARLEALNAARSIEAGAVAVLGKPKS